MNDDFMNLMELEYEELNLALSKASIEGKGTPQEVADRKENLFHDFFGKYFPFPYLITKGNITDSFNKRSASIDCIILDPSHPHTIDSKNKKASIIFADGVDYAIEIKGELKDNNDPKKSELKRALEQVKSVKELTRVRNGLIFKKDMNEYTYKIPTIIMAESTYKDIDVLIDKIIKYYKDNKIKRIHQFDIIVVSGYIIVNSCNGSIFINNTRGLFCVETGSKTLAALLLLMSNMPLVQPKINENIYNIYLNNFRFNMRCKDNWNKELEEIENYK